MVPQHILDLVRGAETAPSATALSAWLMRLGHWYMSPNVVVALCETLAEQGVNLRKAPQADVPTITFEGFELTQEEFERVARILRTVIKATDGTASVPWLIRSKPCGIPAGAI